MTQKLVSGFLKYYPNPKTKNNYQIAIKHFLTHTEHRKKKRTADLDKLAKHYLKNLTYKKRDHKKDLKDFAQKISGKYAPTTVRLYIRLIAGWLDECGYPVKKRDMQRILSLLPPPNPKNETIELKRKTFQILYAYLPEDLQTLLLVLTASGMRIGEALSLKRTDIDWTQKRTAVNIPAEITKTKTARTTYLTKEAAQSLSLYLTYRQDNDPALFLTSYTRAQHHLSKLSEELGYSYTVKGRTYGLHWHMTRKWFLSRFRLAANRDIAEHLAGHEGYLSKSYRRFTKKQILKEYIKAEKKLSLFKDWLE